MMSESRTDVLIDRIASNEEGSGEFAQFEASALSSPGQWERLARALRDELHMRGALNEALEVDASAEIERAYERSREAASGFKFHAWSGWAAAAVLAIAWTISFAMLRTGETPVPPSHAQFASLSADDALEQYLRAGENEGRIIAELPTLLVESYQADDGRLEVYYVRQLLERDRIAHIYELAEDEHGWFVPVQVNPATLLSSPSSM